MPGAPFAVTLLTRGVSQACHTGTSHLDTEGLSVSLSCRAIHVPLDWALGEGPSLQPSLPPASLPPFAVDLDAFVLCPQRP